MTQLKIFLTAETKMISSQWLDCVKKSFFYIHPWDSTDGKAADSELGGFGFEFSHKHDNAPCWSMSQVIVGYKISMQTGDDIADAKWIW